MTKLIYHLPGDSPNTSPFDDAILRVAEQGDVKIVSPYIGISYLQRIIDVSGDWMLISDIEAWLSSLSFRARPRAWGFIRENLDRIHHCPAIHAKTVIGQSLAMLGSANLTNTGILGRTEMGVLLEDPKLVDELHDWFDVLWDQTAPPVIDETNAFVQWLDNEAFQQAATKGKRQVLSSSSQRVRAKLARVEIRSKPQQVEEALDLGSLAHTLVVEEQRHFDSLAESVASTVNELAAHGFTFREFVTRVQSKAGKQSIREIYFALLPHCANHVRSVFADSTINRLVLIGGRFIQSNAELLSEQLASFDNYLSHLIQHLDFDESRALLHVTKLEQLTGIRAIDHEQLIAELLESGFLELIDIPGELAEYRLLDDFEWSGRFKLFAKAYHDWLVAKNSPNRHQRNDAPEDTDHDGAGMDEWSDVLQRLSSTGSKAKALANTKKKESLATVLFRADKIYSWLAKQVKEHGNFLSYPNEIALIEAIQKSIGGKQKVIAPILFRKMDGVPKVFLVSFIDRPKTPCWVRLASELPKGELEALPLTIEAIEHENG